MNKIILLMIALLFAALACAPGPQMIPAGPSAPAAQDLELPDTTPVAKASPSPTLMPVATPKGEQTVNLRAQSLASAKIAVEQDTTFLFDGIKETLKLAGEKTLEEGKTWEFTYDFESRYPGYGNRAGKIMAAVITPHKVRIVVKDGVVAEAVMDERWDMLGQKMIEKK